LPACPTKGTGFVSSLEGGYPIPLPFFGPRFVLEPQAQIIYQQVAFDDATDGLGPLGLGTNPGATGRLGLRGQWTIVGADGELWQPYVRANVWRDWVAQAMTQLGVESLLRCGVIEPSYNLTSRQARHTATAAQKRANSTLIRPGVRSPEPSAPRCDAFSCAPSAKTKRLRVIAEPHQCRGRLSPI
jgi:type V secretory pathway adhesin AidA